MLDVVLIGLLMLPDLFPDSIMLIPPLAHMHTYKYYLTKLGKAVSANSFIFSVDQFEPVMFGAK